MKRSRVFISWSGERSRKIALGLSAWLEDMFQTVELFMSDTDIAAGDVWFDQIGSNLEASRFAIICVSPENVDSRWLHFEAGAIGMVRDERGRGSVVPYLVGLGPADLAPPLSLFQAVAADKQGTFRLVQALNARLSVRMSSDRLDRTFDLWWPSLETVLASVLEPADDAQDSSEPPDHEGPVSEAEFQPPVKSDNRDPRVSFALLLDTSASMGGEPIQQLNEGFKAFCKEIQDDPLARKRAEVLVITFGGTVQVAMHFQEGRDLTPIEFTAGGGTPLGAALDLGLDELMARKTVYKDAGLEYYRPWLFVISDGTPTDGPGFTHAAQRVRLAEAENGVSVFAVGVAGADLDVLRQLSVVREPASLRDLKFVEMFQWLSASMSVVSQSSPGSSDTEATNSETGDRFPLPPPADWAKW